MQKRLIQLTGILFLFCLGFLGLDLSSEKGESLETVSIFGTESFAFGCGAGYLNHQRPIQSPVVCYGGGGDTDFTIKMVHDCADSDASCCRIPSNGSPCPSFGG